MSIAMRRHKMAIKQRRKKIGERAACKHCGQDIEWSGRRHGWTDRGLGDECLVFYDRREGEYVQPPAGQLHEPFEGGR